MASKTFHELFLDEMRDLYSAENQITKALPKLIKAASSSELGRALTNHLEETRRQIERLERIFDGLGESPRGKKCTGMEGLIEEGDEHVMEVPKSSRRDAVIIGAAQRVEHYEISGYGTARAWAEEMGHGEAVSLLERTLGEEAAADEKLTAIALGGVLGEGVNEQAEEGGGGRSGTKSAARKKASSKKGGKRGKSSGRKSSKKKGGKKKAGRRG
ncbi:MAG TPA: ferritin-like domain-containing protein [Gemmatimonadota bacterium]|nr:ferritin-like domain-containing protein [Gemmatimonadota bacterium]